MSTVTTLLNLVKPAKPEQYNLTTYNTNLDLIDAYFGTVAPKRKYVEFITAAFTPPGGGQVLPALSVKTGIQFNNDFVEASATAGQLKIKKSGIYNFNAVLLPSASAGQCNLQAKNITRDSWVIQSAGGQYVGWETQGNGMLYCQANDEIQFKCFETTPRSTGFNVAVTWISV